MTPTRQSTNIERRRARDPWWLYVALPAVTFLAFSRVLRDEFLAYGDPFYVTNNPHVQAGLSWPGLIWAFHTAAGGIWFPLTWLSHMLDVQCYGLTPAGPHLTNILLHVATSVLLFLALNRMTGAMWRSAIVAILFALHPAHVESVAWIAERKGLLCAFFWMLTMYGYASYARKPGPGRYLLTLLFFVLGLMSSPAMVTIPFVLLLLDFWPLRRTFLAAKPSPTKRRIDKAARFQPYPLRRLLLEKAPFLALSLACCWVTLWAGRQSHEIASTLPLGRRVDHAIISYIHYIGMLVFPHDLSVFYPRSGEESRFWVAAAAVALAVISWKAISVARRRPYIFCGWFWFLGTLVPVIGIVWIGDQAWADRYTYLPFIGLFIVIAWSSADLARRYPVIKVVASAVAIAPMIATCIQMGFWKDTRTLFTHAASVTANNYLAYTQLGELKASEGKPEEAAQFYASALRCKQADARAAEVHFLLGNALDSQGKLAGAQDEYLAAIKLKPNFEQAHLCLGADLVRQKKYDEAAIEYRAALEINPDSIVAHNSLSKLPQTGSGAGQSIVR
jgi:protein O-mannosyl-transferase